MIIPFSKMHGAGNDFILVDDRSNTFPFEDRQWLAETAARRTGVGCEGIIGVQQSETADFRMRFFNPDGCEVEMCGNGARCVARYAFDRKLAPEHMRIETAAGILEAQIQDPDVKLLMTKPDKLAINLKLFFDKDELSYGFANTGVPHVVIKVPELREFDVKGIGAKIRYHEDFRPKGTNANFIAIDGPGEISVRTYERGVEDETLACGTGITAAAIIACLSGEVSPPVSVNTAGGDKLVVDLRLQGNEAENVSLLGPAVYTFNGELEYNS
ncbi:MAG: diaminopimelate epimerase [Verrucomicrobiota bacterium]